MSGGTSLSSSRPVRTRSQVASSSNPVPINGDTGSTRSAADTAAGGNTFIRRFGGQEQNWEGEAGPGEGIQSPTDDQN